MFESDIREVESLSGIKIFQLQNKYLKFAIFVKLEKAKMLYF